MRYERTAGKNTSLFLMAVMAALIIGLGLPSTANAVWEYGWKQTDATGTTSSTTTRDCYMALQAPNTSNMRIVGVGHKVGGASGGGRFCIYFDTDADPSTGGSTLQGETGQVSTTTTGAWVWFGLTSPVDLPANQYLGLTYTGNNGGMSYWYDNSSTGCTTPALNGGCLGDALSYWQPGRATALTYTATPASTYPNDGTSYGFTYSSHLIYVIYPTLTSPPTSLQTNQTGVTLSGAGFETQNQFNGTTYGSFYTGTTSKVLLSSSSTWGTGTVVAQTINTWNDTSINFDVVQGALSTGTVYMWVENSDGEHSAPVTVTLSAPGPVTTAPGTVTLSVVSDTQINVSMPYTDNSDGDGNCSVEYNTADSWPGTTAGCSPVSGGSPRTCNITGLSPNTTYYVRVIYTDPDGISGGQPATQVVNDTTTNTGTTVGTMSKLGATTTTITVNVTFTGDSNTNNGCTIRVNNGGWTALTTTKNGSTYEATATGLTIDTAYDFDATFTDANGIYGTNPATGNFSTAGACDAIVNDCADCHAMPPVIDSHQVAEHEGSGTRSDCAVCHFKYASMVNVTSTARWTTNHSNLVLDIYTSGGVGGGIRGGGYLGYRNASTLWEGGTANSNNICANVYCHGATSPVWGTSGGVTCTTCHDNPPLSTGSHGEHTSGTYADAVNHSTAGANDYGCYKCHPVAQHTQGPADANAAAYVTIDFTSAPTQTGGTYTVGTSQGNDARGFEWSNATCTNAMYCHSDGRGGNAQTTPTWGTPMSGCASCHRDASNLNTLTHDEHINNPSAELANYGCVTCHDATVSNDTTVNNKANHINGTKNVSMSTGSYAGTTCSNTACHNTGQATPTYHDMTWGGSAMGCNGCHGTDNYYTDINGSPDYQNVSTTSRNTFNGHQVSGHVSAAGSCIKCHRGITNAFGNLTTNTALHLNGSRNVAFQQGGSYNSTTKRCSGTASACHGSTVVRWGATLGCADCHLDSGSIGTETEDTTYGNATKATINSLEWTNAGHGRSSAFPYTSSPAANKTCTDCHSYSIPHNTAWNPFRIISTAAINPRVINTLCLSSGCHTTTNTNHHSEVVVDANMTGDATWTFTPKCVDCHDPHGDNGNGTKSGSYNAAMIHSSVGTTGSNQYGWITSGGVAVNFPANNPGSLFNWSSFVVNTTYNGICQVCHTDEGPGVTADYFNTGLFTGNHNNGMKCVDCHGHNVGFAGAGGSCTACHDKVQNGRRNVQTDFEMSSHHINATWASISPISCSACHNEGNYADGSVNGTYHKNSVVDLKVWGTFGSSATNVVFVGMTTANRHCMSCHNNTNSGSAVKPFNASGDTGGYPGMYDPAGAGTIAARYANLTTTPFSKYVPTNYNVVPQITKAMSPHGNAANNQRGVKRWTAWEDDGGTKVVGCMDCHNSHGSNALRYETSATQSGLTYSSNVGTFRGGILKHYTTAAGKYDPANGSNTGTNNTVTWSAVADLCWDCHLGDDAKAPKKYTDFGNVSTIDGYYDRGRWRTTDLWIPSHSFKVGNATTTSPGNASQKGGHFGKSSAALKGSVTAQVNGTCDACHDPHGVWPKGTNATTRYMVPALKGTWMTSPYKEDRAPVDMSSTLRPTANTYEWYFLSSTSRRSARLSPRFDYNSPPIVGGGYGTGVASTTWGKGGTGHYGFFIDDNTFGTNRTYATGATITDQNRRHIWNDVGTVTAYTITQTTADFAGLCLSCHSSTRLQNMSTLDTHDSVTIRAHKTVKGWGGSGGANLFKRPDAANHLLGWHTTGTSTNRLGCTKSTADRPYALPAGYRWSVNPGTTVSTSTEVLQTSALANGNGGQQGDTFVQAQFHSFPCSKCHTAHTSKLPRLMKTNCLDVGTSTTNPEHANGGTGEGTYTYPVCASTGAGDVETSRLYTMTCHNTRDSNRPNLGGWNAITGWQ